MKMLMLCWTIGKKTGETKCLNKTKQNCLLTIWPSKQLKFYAEITKNGPANKKKKHNNKIFGLLSITQMLA